jgi:hypothetical protein
MFESPFNSSNLKRANQNSEPMQNAISERLRSQSASGFFETIDNFLEKEKQKLKYNEDLAIYYCDKGGRLIRLSSIGYFPSNSNLIVLRGEDEQGNFEILAHMASFELYVRRLKVEKEELSRRPFGFFNAEIEQEKSDE